MTTNWADVIIRTVHNLFQTYATNLCFTIATFLIDYRIAIKWSNISITHVNTTRFFELAMSRTIFRSMAAFSAETPRTRK
jgi:hypothetical protein